MIGDAVTNDDWKVALGEPREAGAEVADENPFNDPAPNGMEFWIVPVSATYIGDETGLPWVDLEVRFVGSDGRTYSDYCGVIPGDLMDVDELYADATGGLRIMSDNTQSGPIAAPAGWYPDQHGNQHYWNGSQWVDAAPIGMPTTTGSPVPQNGLGIAALILGVIGDIDELDADLEAELDWTRQRFGERHAAHIRR